MLSLREHPWESRRGKIMLGVGKCSVALYQRVWLRNAAGRRNKYMWWLLQAYEMVMLWLQRMKHHRGAPPVTQGSSLTKIAIMGQTLKS